MGFFRENEYFLEYVISLFCVFICLLIPLRMFLMNIVAEAASSSNPSKFEVIKVIQVKPFIPSFKVEKVLFLQDYMERFVIILRI